MKQAPTKHQLRYVRRLMSEAHGAGVPYLPIDRLNREAVSAWIEYLEIVVRVHRDLARIEQQLPDPYLVTPPRSQLPASYEPPYRELSAAVDHEHIVGTVTREDGIVESVCVMCGVSA
jgi:hypothetical protein